MTSSPCSSPRPPSWPHGRDIRNHRKKAAGGDEGAEMQTHLQRLGSRILRWPSESSGISGLGCVMQQRDFADVIKFTNQSTLK